MREGIGGHVRVYKPEAASFEWRKEVVHAVGLQSRCCDLRTQALATATPPHSDPCFVLLAGSAKQLPSVCTARFTGGIATQHPRYLGNSFLVADGADTGGRHTPGRVLANHHVPMRTSRNLRQVCDGQHLMVHRKISHCIANL